MITASESRAGDSHNRPEDDLEIRQYKRCVRQAADGPHSATALSGLRARWRPAGQQALSPEALPIASLLHAENAESAPKRKRFRAEKKQRAGLQARPPRTSPRRSRRGSRRIADS